MALSGTITKSITGRQYVISWSATQSVANNTSTITCVHKLVNNSTYSLYINSRTNSCTVGSDTKSYTSAAISTSGGSTITLGTTTHTVSHNSDGSKSVTISGTFNIQATLSGTYTSSLTASATVTLDTIPRAATITSASNITLGNKCGITFTPASSSFYYNIKFSIGNWYINTGLFCPGTTSAYTYNGYTISGTTTSNSTTIYAQLPSSTSGTMTATLTTYTSNSTSASIGTSSKTFTVTIPSSVVPTVGTITLTPQTYNYLIQGKNKVKVSVSGCSAGTGSSISSYTFSGPNLSSTTTNTYATSNVVASSGTLTYTVKVTDARGRTASKTATITSYAYAAPYFSSFTAYRSNSSGTANDSGTYIKCSYTLSFSSVNSTNDVTVKILYKKSSASSYSSTTVLTDSTSTSGSKILSSIALDSTYTVYATITDNYSGSSSSIVKTIFGAERILNITSDGTGVAFGKMAESSELFESRYKIKAPGLLSTRDGRSTTNININADEEHLGCLESFITKSGVTGNPGADGHIIHCHWDNTGGYDSQLFIKNSTGALISRGCDAGTWSDWRISLDSINYTSYVLPRPTMLYSSTSGTIGTVTLSYSAANYTYLEIFYMDNNSNGHNSVRIYSPNGKKIDLSLIEPSDSTASRTYIRRSLYTISGTSLIPTASVCGYVQIDSGTVSHVTGTNYLKIIRVLGYT